MNRQSRNLQKVVFVIPHDSLYGGDTETMWALGLGGDFFRLRNVPFFALGISFDDVFQAKLVEGKLQFERVTFRGGHSTYRIYVKEGRHSKQFSALVNVFNQLGARIEAADDKLVALDVPPETDIYEIYAVLEQAKNSGFIDFQEGHCGHPLAGGPRKPD